jgi:hypothetical protein
MATSEGALTKPELETVVDFCNETADEALADGSRDALVSALSTISDVCHPDSFLAVDTEAGTVEVTGWAGEEEGDEEDAEGDFEE